ncbi:RSP_7527 family protein [Salinispirillum marinum]|uniref:RSP_7527 family protein n=2 Tax=Saccharospirillaceae TaxID=255527 RepID=A0ABV8BDL3_9GAMM
MKNTESLNLVVNEWNVVDVNYYETKARQMRAEAIADMTSKVVAFVAQRVRALFAAPHQAKSA